MSCSDEKQCSTKIRCVDKTRPCKFDPEVLEYLKSTFPNANYLDNVLRSLSAPPRFTTVRLDSLNSPGHHDDIISNLTTSLGCRFTLSKHPLMDDVVVIAGNRSQLVEDSTLPTVVVDVKCSKAVLRGAEVFSPGVKGLPCVPEGSNVAVHVDITSACRRGEKSFSGQTAFIANGVLRMTRHDIFKMMITTGVAVEIVDRVIDVPCLHDTMYNFMFLQNLPSIVTCHVLDPRPGDHILDMCAAPGGKTTHIAHLINNNGSIIALEKVQRKIEKLIENVSKQNIHCVSVFKCDSTKAFSELSTSTTMPPFGPEVFDRVLVDPPCSALGQRPQLSNSAKLSSVSNYPSYQWGFVADAVKMLKKGGTLVYSTCTLPKQENEMVVARVLKTFPSIVLVPAHPALGGPGVIVDGLDSEQVKMVQRFTPNSATGSDVNSDTIGFFIAKFLKKS